MSDRGKPTDLHQRRFTGCLLPVDVSTRLQKNLHGFWKTLKKNSNDVSNSDHTDLHNNSFNSSEKAPNARKEIFSPDVKCCVYSCNNNNNNNNNNNFI